MENKTHWKKMHNPNYLGAYSLLGYVEELTVTIERVVNEPVKGTDGKEETCTVAYLKGQKPMILNKTNCKTIAKIHKTPFIEDWTGKQITLYVANVRAFGETVEALRVKNKAPQATKPDLSPEHPDWQNCIQALLNGYTVQQLEARFTISEKNKELLINQAI